MSIELHLPPEIESRLQQYADEAQMDISRLIADIIHDRLQTVAPNGEGVGRQTGDELSARFQAWVDSFPPITHFVDDSRESIYEDRS